MYFKTSFITKTGKAVERRRRLEFSVSIQTVL